MSEKREYILTDDQMKRLKEASRPVAWFAPGGVWPKTPQENANDAWREVAEEAGFVWDTVEPVPGKPENVIRATPTPGGPG